MAVETYDITPRDALAGEIDDLVWDTVESSNLNAVAYAPGDTAESGRLYISFKPSATRPATIYVYYGVPLGVYQGLLSAPSKGTYVYYVLRNKGKDNRYRYDLIHGGK